MAYSDGDSSLHGVGGWMNLFLFGFGFVGPLMLVFGTERNLYGDPVVKQILGDRFAIYEVASWTIVALGLAIVGYTVWRLFKRQNPRTVLITILAIPAIGFGLPLLDIAISMALVDIDPQLLFAEIAPDLFRSLVYCAIWCTYFKVSKRVRNTYVASLEDGTAKVFQ